MKYDVNFWKTNIDKQVKNYQQYFDDVEFVNNIYMKNTKDIKEKYRGYVKYGSDFPMFWSNIQTVMPMLFNRVPKPNISRSFKDKDKIGLIASKILERASYSAIDNEKFKDSVSSAVLDYVLGGQGIVWVRYVPTIVDVERSIIAEDEDELLAEQSTYQDVVEEKIEVDYVLWKNILFSDANTWDDVEWVARRELLSRSDLRSRFGETADNVILMSRSEDDEKDYKVWEIWCKTSKKVYWICEGYNEFLDEKDDPLQLEGFYPCPKPMLGTKINNSLIPIPDYIEAMGQYQELDNLTNRINKITAALGVRGIYDAKMSEEISNLLSSGENKLIPVKDLGLNREKGLSAAIEYLPIEQVANVLLNLISIRAQIKKDLDEVTGFSDIIRGQTVASETATAQRIKGQFASVRIKSKQDTVNIFVRDLIRIIAEIISNHFSDENLFEYAGGSMMSQEELMQFPQALELLRDDNSRNFRIEVDTDDMAIADQQADKESRIEFMTAFTSAMQGMMPLAQANPAMGKMIGQMLLFGVRGFKVGRDLEGTIEETIDAMMNTPPSPPQPSDAQIKMQMQDKQIQADMQMAQMDNQSKVMLENVKSANKVKVNAMEKTQEVMAENARSRNAYL